MVGPVLVGCRLVSLFAVAVIAVGCVDRSDSGAEALGPTTALVPADCEPTLTPGIHQEEGRMGEEVRRWQVSVPADVPRGVIFDFHGTSGTIEFQDATTRLSSDGARRGYVVVTPQGERNPARWTVPAIPGPDDVLFVTELLAYVRDRVCVGGPAFATGRSSGAAMSTQLACETDLFLGIAPVAGIGLYRRCPTGDPVSVLTYHGTEDEWVPLEGRPGWEEDEAIPRRFFVGSAEMGVLAFVERNDCGEPDIETIGTDTTAQWWSCEGGHRVGFLVIEGHGHGHPGDRARQAVEKYGRTESLGPTTSSFDGTLVLLDFFDDVLAATQQPD